MEGILLWCGDNVGFREASGDKSTRAITTIEYEHHEIHGGSHYFIDTVVSRNINHVFDIQWTTPNTTKEAHFTFDVITSGQTSWYAYEGAVIAVPGSAVTPFNSDRNSLKTSTQTIALHTAATVALATAITETSAATLFASGVIGAGRTGGFVGRDREIILRQNTIYCFRVVATAAADIGFVVNWYEHTVKP